MPLLRVSQQHSCFELKDFNAYKFNDKQKPMWLEFWKEMDGDTDKLLDFAKNAEIDNPIDWVNTLHKFLFDFFSGSEKLLKQAAKKDFKAFLTQVAENHINDPKEKYWYFKKGLKIRDFIRVMENAACFEKADESVRYINARTPDYGAELYSEWLLSKAINKKELVSVASDLNKKAYRAEEKLTGRTILDVVKVDGSTKLTHMRFPGSVLTVVGVHRPPLKVAATNDTEDKSYMVIKDQHGKTGYIFDPWNVKIVK